MCLRCNSCRKRFGGSRPRDDLQRTRYLNFSLDSRPTPHHIRLTDKGVRAFSIRERGPLFAGEKEMNELVRPVTAKFDPELFDALQESARRNRCSLSDVVRQSVVEHLEHIDH